MQKPRRLGSRLPRLVRRSIERFRRGPGQARFADAWSVIPLYERLTACLAKSRQRSRQLRGPRGRSLWRVCVPALEPLENRWLLAADYVLDSAFDVDGLATFDPGSAGVDLVSGSHAMAIQSDGKIIVVGKDFTSGDFAIVRINVSGSLDTGFGNAGTTLVDFGGSDNFAHGVAIDSLGRIVVVGRTNAGSTGYNFAIARLTFTGELDGSFAESSPGANDGGKINFNVGNASGSNDEAFAVVIAAADSILVAGKAQDNLGSDNTAVVKFTSEGRLDLTFGTSGIAKKDAVANGRSDGASSMTLDGSGRIVLAGWVNRSLTGNDFLVARLTSVGDWDSDFANAGIRFFGVAGAAAVGVEDQAFGVTVDPSGRIIAAGTAKNVSQLSDFALIALDASGDLDTSFGANGVFVQNLSASAGGSDSASGVRSDANGRLLVVGDSTGSGTGSDFTLIRLTPSGGIDTTLDDGDGIYRFHFGATSDEAAHAVGLDGNGSIVLAGLAGPALDFGVARLAPLPPSVSLPATGGHYELVFDSSTGDVVLREVGMPATELFRQPAGSFPSLTIHGADNADDLLAVNLAGANPIPAGGLTFHGGAGGNDSLELIGGAFDTTTYNYTSPNDGNIVLDPDGMPGGGSASTITYTGLEPLANTGTAAHIVFNLPAGPNSDVVLGDDGLSPDPDGNTANTSALDGSTFEFTQFTNPTSSLTLNLAGSGDTLGVHSLDSGFSANLTVSGGAGSDAVRFESAVNLNAGSLSMHAVETIDVNAGVTAAAGIDFGLPTTTSLAAGLQTDGGGIAIHAGAIVIQGGLVTLDTSLTQSAGAIDLSGATISADAANRSLKLDTFAQATRTAGDISIGPVNSAAGFPLQNLTALAHVGGGTPNAAQAAHVVFLGSVEVTGELSVAGREIDFAGGSGSVAGNTLALRPGLSGENAFGPSGLVIGGAANDVGDTALDITDADLAALADGFASIVVGLVGADGGQATIEGATFLDPVRIEWGAIAVTGLDAGSNLVELVAGAGSITDAGDAATDITGGDVRLDTEGGLGRTIGAAGDPISLSVADSLTVVFADDVFLTSSGVVDVADFSDSMTLDPHVLHLDGGVFVFDRALDTRSHTTLQVAAAATLRLSTTTSQNFAAKLLLDGILENAAGDNTWSGMITVGSTIDVDTGATLTISGQVSGGGGLTKAGEGTLVLSHVGSDYLGVTELQGGTLAVTGMIDSVVDLQGGTLAGTGTVGGITSSNSGSAVAPGGSTGVLTVDGDVALGATDVLAIGIAGTASGEFDQLVVTGAAALAGALDVDLVGGFAPAVGDSFLVLDGMTSGDFAVQELPILPLDRQWEVIIGSVTVNVVSTDATPPTVSSVAANLATIADANVGSQTFTITIEFDEDMDQAVDPMISFPTEDPSGTMTPNMAASDWTGPRMFVAVYDMADAGAAIPSIDVRVVGAEDLAGNVLAAYTELDLFGIEMQNPTLTVHQAGGQPDPTSVQPILFTVVFSEPVTGFDMADVQLGGTAGVAAATVVVTQSGPLDGTTYTISVTGAMGNGTVLAAIPAGAATDAAGNASLASTSTDNTVTLANAIASSTTVASSPNPSAVGDIVTFTATVSGGAIPAGLDVVFTDTTTGTSLGTRQTDAGGSASLQVSSLAVGTHTIEAAFQGGGGFALSQGTIDQVVDAISTTTTIDSSSNPSPFGSSVTFTAVVSAHQSGLVPTGTVTFRIDGGGDIVVPLDGTGQASLTTSTLSVGTHSITADYASVDGQFVNSLAMLTQSILQVATVTELTSSDETSFPGQTVTFIAMVTATEGMPTGAVSFRIDGGASIVVALDSAGKASFTTSALSVGMHTIMADFTSNSPGFSNSSDSLSQTVATLATTTEIVSSDGNSFPGQTVTFTAMVTATEGMPTGAVSFRIDGGASIVVALDSAGKASFTTSALSVGMHTIMAEYVSDSIVFTDSSGSLTQNVAQVSTATTLTSSDSPAEFGQLVIYTATVTAPEGGTPTGSVTFRIDGGSDIVVAVDAFGQAVFSTSALAAGLHTITAQYISNSSVFLDSSAVSLTQTVVRAGSTTAVSGMPNPSVLNGSVTLTATVAKVGGSSPVVPSGVVTFVDTRGDADAGNDVVLGSDSLDASGLTTLIVSSLLGGERTIRADYGGDASFLSSSGTFIQTVHAFDYGDAPDASGGPAGGNPFPTLLAHNGARHTAIGPRLGAARDVELDGQPNVAATGDDASGSPDDEDGLVSVAPLVALGAGAVTVNVQGVVGTVGLDVWIDFNHDTAWQAAERVTPAAGFPVSTTGNHTITFPVPAAASAGSTYLRVRLSTFGGLMPFGPASEGEVEDHVVTILAPPSSVYVDDSFASLPPGTQIADADATTPGNQPATIDFNAFGSIQQAIDVAAAGGVVAVQPGTYTENLTIAKDLSLVGLGDDPSEVVIMPPASGAQPNGVTITSPASDVTLENFTVMGFAGDGVNASGVVSLELIEVASMDNDDDGFDVTGFGEVLFDGTLAENNGGHGMNLAGGGAITVQGAASVGNDPGIFVSGAASYSDTGSTYSGNDDGGIVLEDITGSVTLTNITANDNDADANSVGDGLAIRDGADAGTQSVGGNVTITGGSFSNTAAAGGQLRGGDLRGPVGGHVVLTNAALTGNSVAGLVLSGLVASISQSNFNTNGTGLVIQPQGTTDSLVDLGGGASGLALVAGLPVSAGGNDFSSYTAGMTAIANLNNHASNHLAGPQGFPADVPAHGNTFFSTAGPAIESVIVHDFDDSSRGLVDFARLANLVTSTSAAALIEGQSLTLSGSFQNSPKEHTVTIDWGDGQSTTLSRAPGTETFSATHAYRDDAPSGTPADSYAISVTVTDDDGEVLADTTKSVLVQNAIPVFTSLALDPASVPAGGLAELTGTFSDPGVLDTFVLDVDTDGDGSFEFTNIPVSGGAFTYNVLFNQAPGAYPAHVRIRDDDGGVTSGNGGMLSVTVRPSEETGVQDVHLFYNNSQLDGNGPAVTAADFAAIALDKRPLMAGGLGSFASISGYSRGINGIFLDVANLPADGAGIDAADFEFRVGTDNLPHEWANGPLPAVVGVLPDVGTDGSDRIYVTFADRAVVDTWLGVTLLANSDTGLPDNVTYFFASAPGETGASFHSGRVGVDAADLQAIAGQLFRSAGAESPLDLNRDGTIDAFDLQVVALNLDFSAFPLIAPQEPALLTAISTPTMPLPLTGRLAGAGAVRAARDVVFSQAAELPQARPESAWFVRNPRFQQDSGSIAAWRTALPGPMGEGVRASDLVLEKFDDLGVENLTP